MPFSERDKLIALAIVHIFETSKPFGDYAAVAVLNDGAGISYGINQFTHKSGSLYAVLDRFAKLGGELTHAIGGVMQDLATKSRIQSVSANATVKSDLRRLGADPLMHQAQREIAFEKYLAPAIRACEGSDFEMPLSLAVVYDSINHGSFDKIRDRVVVQKPGNGSMTEQEFEKEWITRYVKKRDAWLESSPRLKVTDYRTDFFLAQIARDNWNLNLPLNVHGFKLTNEILDGVEAQTFADLRDDEINIEIPAAEPRQTPQDDHSVNLATLNAADKNPAEAQPTQQAEAIVNVGDQNVPANFTAENKTLIAPESSGMLSRGWKWIAGLGLLPTSFAGLMETVKNYSADGNFNTADALRTAKDVFIFLLPYLFWIGLAFVVFWGVKELLKQVSFMLTQYTLAR
ncbi:MAG: chitosanase, partial [Acidobacteriota bacterium]